MIFQKKIPAYVLIYDQVEIIRETLEHLKTLRNKLDLIVIENPSSNSPQIQSIITDLANVGAIKRHYLFTENIAANAFDIVLNIEKDMVAKSPYVLVSDGDLISTDTKWLAEEIKIIKGHKNVFACGVSLDRSNLPVDTFPSANEWIPQDKFDYGDYIEAPTGAHLLLFRGKELAGFLVWKNKYNRYFIDGELHEYCYAVLNKMWSRTKYSQAYHLTWDLYKDKENAYTKLKTGTSFKDTWYHRKTAEYSVTQY